MKITREQFAIIAPHLPVQRGNVSIDNYTFICALLYIIEHGCKWRGLPEKFGNWHTIYVRLNRWTKDGVISRLFEVMQERGIIDVNMRVVCIDSTSIRVHPDGTGAEKKTAHKASVAHAAGTTLKFIWSPRMLVRLSSFR